MDDFERMLKFTFLEEAEQMLSDCEQNFLLLESSTHHAGIIDKIFRVAHSFKGSAGVAGFQDLSTFAHHLESLLAKIKTGSHAVDQETTDLLLRANDELKVMVTALKANPYQRFSIEAFVSEIEVLLNASPRSSVPQAKDELSLLPAEVEEEKKDAETRSGFHMFDDNPVPAAASLSPHAPIQETARPAKPQLSSLTHPAAPSSAAAAGSAVAPAPAAAEESIRVNLRRIDELVNDVGELVILQTVLYEHRHLVPSDLLQKTISHLEKITRKIQDSSMNLRMVPLTLTFQKMQRIVRDASQQLNKKMRLKTIGDDTEIDKTVLDLLGDPLVHLVRNAADHGIESPEEREAAGKPREGTVTLRAYHHGEHIVVEIHDDGKGLDKDKLIAKAEKMGVIAPGSVKTESEAYQLIFMSGVSTKEEVTSISGRGVGMDVVKTNVEQIQGRIEIESTLGKGSCFRILLPLTLAIIDGMIVAIGEQRFVIPITAIHESIRPAKEDISHVAQRGSYLNVRGQTIQLFKLSKILHGHAPDQDSDEGIAIVGKSKNGMSFAVLVDDIICQQQIVIKRLGEELQGLPGLTGAAILGDGKAALIIDLVDLIQVEAKQSNRVSKRKDAA